MTVSPFKPPTVTRLLPLQLKATTDAFEGAVNCEIAGQNGKVWLEYAKFQEERKRHKTAQKVYLRALVGDESSGGKPGADEEYHPMLWDEFLRMMRALNNAPNLSLQELRDAVEKEHVAQMKEAGVGAQWDDATADDDGGPPLKRPKVEDTANALAMAMSIPGQPLPMSLDNPVMSAESIEKETAAVVESVQQLSPDISAAWFARDGDSPPSRPEPPLFTPSPPKFSDATGRDILGDELSLALIRMLLKKDGADESGNILLDVCRGCWMMTALKEKEAAKAVETLDAKMVRMELFRLYDVLLLCLFTSSAIFCPIYMFVSFLLDYPSNTPRIEIWKLSKRRWSRERRSPARAH